MAGAIASLDSQSCAQLHERMAKLAGFTLLTDPRQPDGDVRPDE